MKRPFLSRVRALVALTALLCLGLLLSNPSPAAEKPNVVVIFIDDMGYGDIGPFGTDHPTPNLDQMAAEGMKLTDFYVSSSACTPSRSALLTGCYADRIGMGASVVFPADKRGLNPDEITIAEILKKGGYANGCFGKWHLGDQPEFMPLAQGFDVYEGIPYSNDMWVMGNKKRNYPPLPWMKQGQAVAHIPDAPNQAAITDAITDATVNFITENKDEPFFAYVPHSAVHAPFMVTPERLQAAGGDVMRALIGEIDHSTGRILDTLRELGIDKNTLVLFTNDNGGGGKTSSGPLRGGKFGPKYEGHMRVSTLAWWPGNVPAGSVTSEIGTTTDLLPTIATLAGQPVPSDRIIDGHDISDILLGKPGAKSPHETLYYENDGIRQGKWKLVHYRVKADWFTELYDLEADLGERNNIAAQHPDKVTELKAALDAHVAKIEANLRPAAFVESPKPLLADSKGIPSLVEYLGNTKTVAAAPASVKKKSAPPAAAGANLPPSRDLEITGRHLLLPIAPRKRPDGSDHIGNSFRIFVDGKTFTSDLEGTRQTIGGTLKAAQCFSNAPDGRAICMVWSRVKPQDPKAPFNQGFTLPLELSLRTARDGVRCYANPVVELEALRAGKLAAVENQAVEDEYRVPLQQTESLLEIDLTIRYKKDAKPDRVILQLGGNSIVYDVAKNHFPDARLTSFDPEDGKLDLRVFVDNATVEVFGEKGSVYYLQPRKVQDESVDELIIKTEGGPAIVSHLNAYQLKSIWE